MRHEASPIIYLSSAMGILAVALLLTLAWLASAHAATKDSAEKAEWVTRCDRVKEAERFDCLDKLRAEARERYYKERAEDEGKSTTTMPPAKSPATSAKS